MRWWSQVKSEICRIAYFAHDTSQSQGRSCRRACFTHDVSCQSQPYRPYMLRQRAPCECQSSPISRSSILHVLVGFPTILIELCLHYPTCSLCDCLLCSCYSLRSSLLETSWNSRPWPHGQQCVRRHISIRASGTSFPWLCQ